MPPEIAADPLQRLRRLRLRSQLLDPSDAATSAYDVVRRLGAVQAQERRAWKLGIRVRSKGLTAESVERERTEDRSFVRVWAMRGTVHLVAAEDLRWMRALFGELPGNESYRRLAMVGIDRDTADRALRLLERILADGPMPRSQVGEALRRKGIEIEGGQALFHLARFATVKGVTVIAPEVGGEDSLVLTSDWIRTKDAEPEDPPAELARRYLKGHGPGSFEDFEQWSGLRRSVARAGWSAIAGEVEEERVGEMTLRRLRDGAARPAGAGIVRLLPMFDSLFLGYRDRSFLGPPEVLRSISKQAGMIHQFVAADGRAVARWRLDRKGRGFAVSLEPFVEHEADRPQLEREVEDVARFMGTDAMLV